MAKETGQTDSEIEELTDIGLSFRVLLFNDDFHTFDEVISQIMKATSCSFERARDLSIEAHINGSAIVFSAGLSKCLFVSSVLEEIGLRTQVLS